MATQQEIDAAKTWNTNFSNLNNIPVDNKQDPMAQQSYYHKLITNNQASGAYKNPTGYTGAYPTQYGSTPAPTGLMSQPPAPTTPSTTPTGAYTFEDQARDRYGVTAPTAPTAPAVSSAPNYANTVATKIANHDQFAGQTGTSLYTLANQERNSPVAQTATSFTGQEPYGTGTGPNGTYTFDDQARDRYGAANTNKWTADMANASPDLGAPNPWASSQTALSEINRRLAERGLPPQTPEPISWDSMGQQPISNEEWNAKYGPGGQSTEISTTNTVAPVGGKVGYEARQLGDPTKWDVTDDQTVSGQVRKLIDENNPLQQQAATRSLQRANASGLMNSSMAVQAGQAAMYDAAIPMATTDAATYGRAAAYNADTQNQFAGKNVDASNTAYNATSNIRANTARDTAATIAQANLADKQGNISAQAAANLANVNKEAAGSLAGVNAATAAKLAQTNTSAAVLKAQNDISVAAAGAVNDRQLTDFKAGLQRAQIGQEQSLLISRDMTAEINAIQASDKFGAAEKEQKIRDVVARANISLELIHRASKLTGDILKFEDKTPPNQTTPTTPPSAPPVPPPGSTGNTGSWTGGLSNGGVNNSGLMTNSGPLTRT